MPNYPGSIPSFPTLTNSDYIQAGHLVHINQEIERICKEVGLNPGDPAFVDSSVVPNALPQDVKEYLDMLANIANKMAGTEIMAPGFAGVPPARHFIAGHGNAGTIAAGATNYIYIPGMGLTSTENDVKVPVPYACTFMNARLQLINTQPGTGSLVVTLRKNGVATSLTFTFAAGGSGINGANGSVAFAAGDLMSFSIKNNASSASAQIGGLSAEVDQNG